MAKAKKAQGRPSSFTEQVASEICERIAHGESLRAVCRDAHMPDKATVMRWLNANDSFCDQYARAKSIQADHFAEEIIEIADEGEDANRDRLRVDTRKWLMARMAPKKYGDRVINHMVGAEGGPIEYTTTSDLMALGAEFAAKHGLAFGKVNGNGKANGKPSNGNGAGHH